MYYRVVYREGTHLEERKRPLRIDLPPSLVEKPLRIVLPPSLLSSKRGVYCYSLLSFGPSRGEEWVSFSHHDEAKSGPFSSQFLS